MAVHVDHAAMADQKTKLGNTRAELEGVVEVCRGQIEELTSSGFNTEAASKSFSEAHERWNLAVKKMFSELDVMGQYLDKASQGFGDVDQAFKINL